MNARHFDGGLRLSWFCKTGQDAKAEKECENAAYITSRGSKAAESA